MRLVDLRPVFASHGGSGIYDAVTGDPIPETLGIAILFDCPCGDAAEEHRCLIPFVNPIGPGPYIPQDDHGWQRTGDTFETLTLTPSIQRRDGCRWHGCIMNGSVVTVP